MYKFQQVLRSASPLTAENGTVIPENTRVVVMSENEQDRTVRVKVEDKNVPSLRKARVVAGYDAFTTTRRGAPRGPRRRL